MAYSKRAACWWERGNKDKHEWTSEGERKRYIRSMQDEVINRKSDRHIICMHRVGFILKSRSGGTTGKFPVPSKLF